LPPHGWVFAQAQNNSCCMCAQRKSVTAELGSFDTFAALCLNGGFRLDVAKTVRSAGRMRIINYQLPSFDKNLRQNRFGFGRFAPSQDGNNNSQLSLPTDCGAGVR
jgi:hypothetical protein